MESCLDDNTVLELVCGTLELDLQGRAQEHLDRCDACRELVASSVPESEHAVDDWGHLQIGAQLGRYQITDILGAGAMGFVFAATDPELDRTVALKLLRASGAAAEALRPRLLREAQALARLSHPNVVAVHDVGSFGEHLFVALEWVDGGTLATWLEQPRSAREIVGAFRQAGEGLAAAHAAGLVHRDVKPDNVLVGKDGRVRVTDFGLALAIEDVPENTANAEVTDLRLTATGALVGTPAYVSPEQLDGQAADVRSDQFSFCVALFEALHGYKPFAGDDWPTLRTAVRTGVVVRRNGRRVPRWLDRIVVRGMRRDPDERWPAMRALLDALARGPLVTPSRATLATGVVGVAAFAMIANVHRDPCADLGDLAVWSEASAITLRARLASHSEVAGTVDRAFRDYGTAWSKMTRESCRATKVEGTQTREALAVRDRCLAERRDYAQQLAAALLDGPSPRPDGALEVASGLPSIDECANVGALLAIAPAPTSPTLTVRRASLQARMAHATIEGYLRADLDPQTFQVLADEAHALGVPTLEARALLLRAHYEPDETAEEIELQGSAIAAFAAHDDAALVDAWQRLAFHTGFHAARYQESAQWAAYAQAAIDRLGGDPVREAELQLSRGWALLDEGRIAEAKAAMTRARELFVQTRGPDSARVAAAINGQGAVELYAGKFAEALDLYQQARDLGKRLGGTSSQAYVMATDNAANALIDLGRIDDGLALFTANDRTSETTSWRQEQIAAALRRLHRFDEALARDQRAQQLSDAEKQSGPRASAAPYGIGLDLVGLGRPLEALPLLERVLVARAHSTPDDLAAAQFAVAKALRVANQDPRRARDLANQARDRFEPLGALYAADLGEIDAFLERAR